VAGVVVCQYMKWLVFTERKKGAFTGAFFVVRTAYHVCELWQPESPPALGLHVVLLKLIRLLSVAETVASEIGAVNDAKWIAASFVTSWHTVQALP